MKKYNPKQVRPVLNKKAKSINKEWNSSLYKEYLEAQSRVDRLYSELLNAAMLTQENIKIVFPRKAPKK